jgi:ABC-type glycerol-3-phosphate transport system substrate-binding protein
MASLSRRHFLGTAALTGAGALLAACGAQAGTGAMEEAPAAEGDGDSGEMMMEKSPVVFWYTGFDPWNFDREEIPMQIRQEFDETTNYTIVPLIRGNGGFRDIPTVVAAGVAPDNSKTQSYIQPQWGLLELVRPMDAYISASANVPLDDLWPGKYEAMQWAGKTYGISYSIDARVIYLNVDHSLEAGLDPETPPASRDEMDEALLKVHKTEGDNITRLGWDPFRGSGGIHTWMVGYWQQGGEMLSPDRTKIQVNNDLAINTVTWLKKVLDGQGGYDKVREFHGTFENRLQEYGSGGNTYMYLTNATRASLGPYAEGLEYDFGPYPALDPSTALQATYSGDWAFCLPNGSSNPDGGFAWADFMYGADVNLRWSIAMDRIPVRQSVAQSEAYIGDDKLRKLAIDEMVGARFVVSVPGAGDILPITSRSLQSIMRNEVTVAEGMRTFEEQAQTAMDDFIAEFGG